jgi:hypothetical protein
MNHNDAQPIFDYLQKDLGFSRAYFIVAFTLFVPFIIFLFQFRSRIQKQNEFNKASIINFSILIGALLLLGYLFSKFINDL